jgi:hypothetical protein
MRVTALVVAVLLVVAVGGLALGYQTAPKVVSPNPIRLEGGVPVGVVDTPVGAIAAAENYLATEDDALLSRDGIRQVVDAVWAPAERDVELAQPFPAAALAGKPATFPGLELSAAVAGAKLESYTPQSAQVIVWHEITLWSPTVAPTQRWSLDTVTLVWDSGRWLVASRTAAPDSETPVPAWTSGTPQDTTSEAFDTRLAGMSTPYYRGLTP